MFVYFNFQFTLVKSHLLTIERVFFFDLLQLYDHVEHRLKINFGEFLGREAVDGLGEVVESGVLPNRAEEWVLYLESSLER